VFHPFSWDRTLMQVDRAIHFGVQPWEWLHPWLANPWLTSGISYLYNLWIPLMWLVVYWQIFRLRDRALRMQFLLAFVFCWAVLGSLLAL
ncbi:phosphatase PAP2 family protein, partial [Bacillus sp. SIMBA_161]